MESNNISEMDVLVITGTQLAWGGKGTRAGKQWGHVMSGMSVTCRPPDPNNTSANPALCKITAIRSAPSSARINLCYCTSWQTHVRKAAYLLRGQNNTGCLLKIKSSINLLDYPCINIEMPISYTYYVLKIAREINICYKIKSKHPKRDMSINS